jgi:MoaA/NifB/PqqE/SkfB family radical SAM enzyme
VRVGAIPLRDAGLSVTLFTSGWTLEQEHVDALASCVDGVGLSIDGAGSRTHDRVRGREGSFDRACASLAKLAAHKRARRAAGEPCFTLGLEFTAIRSNVGEVGEFVERFTEAHSEIDTLRIGTAIPEGPAADQPFAEEELLSEDEMLALLAMAPSLQARARNGVAVSVTDMRYDVP